VILHHDLVTAPGSSPSRTVVFLHGILGSGSNLRTHARRLVEAQPHLKALLVDLRAHGRSLGLDGVDSVESAAEDVLETARHLGLHLKVAVGHSFGGKVALQLGQAWAGLEQVVTLDSSPGTRADARGSESTLRILELLEGLQGPFPTRDAFLAAVEAGGQPRTLAQWLAMNLERKDDGLSFRLDLGRIRALLESYFVLDLWPSLEAASRLKIDLVIGTRSTVYDAAERARAERLGGASGGRLRVHLLDAGHWLHVEDLEGVVKVLGQVVR
jgi:pimeloyl-ACP methyl ester carboxylesterase